MVVMPGEITTFTYDQLTSFEFRIFGIGAFFGGIFTFLITRLIFNKKQKVGSVE